MDIDNIKQILALVREHELAEFELEHEGLRLKIRKDAAAPILTVPAALPAMPALAAAIGAMHPQAPAAPAGAAAGSGPAAVDAEAEIELAVVKSPIVGTFYRSAEPAAPSFVEIGSPVKKGQVLCIIEAMKLMNEIDSEYDGEIEKIYV